MLAALVSINIAAVGGLAGVVLANYRSTTDLNVTMHGANGDAGFIEDTQRANAEMTRKQRDISNQIEVHGDLLHEVAYTTAEVAEHVDGVIDGDIDTDRLEDVHGRALDHRDDRWRDSGGGGRSDRRHGFDDDD